MLLDPVAAHKKFKNKTLITKGCWYGENAPIVLVFEALDSLPDFSDAVDKHGRSAGYLSLSEYELVRSQSPTIC